jgi:hypothetical protein
MVGQFNSCDVMHKSAPNHHITCGNYLRLFATLTTTDITITSRVNKSPPKLSGWAPDSLDTS